MSEVPSSRLRIGDADRESALQALGEHMSVGRIDLDEYGERSAKITAARTRGDLVEVFDDLPEPHPAFDGVTATPAGTPAQRSSGSGYVSGGVQVTAGGALQWADRPLGRRLVAASIPIVFAASIIVGVTTGFWYLMILPFVIGAVGKNLWGREWQRHVHHDGYGDQGYRSRDEIRRDHREMRRELRGDTRDMRDMRRRLSDDRRHHDP